MGWIAVAVPLIVAALLSARPISHDDTFWHLRIGEMAVEQRLVPTTDPFSFTRAGEPFVSHEWGFGALLHLVHAAGGLEALYGLQILLSVLIVLSLAALLMRETDSPRERMLVVPALLLLGIWAGVHELKLNAALLTTLFLVWELAWLDDFNRDRKPWRLLPLGLLFLVWANVHCGVVFGVALLGCRWIDALALRFLPTGWLDGARETKGASPQTWAGILLGAILVSLVNPNGIEAPLYPFRLSWFLFTTHLPLDMGHFTAPTPEDRPGFFSLAALLFGALVFRPRDVRVRLFDLLPVLAFLVLSIRSNRFIFDFVVFSLPLLFGISRRAAIARLPSIAPAGVTVLAAVLAARDFSARDRSILAPEFPVHAAAFLEREGVRGHMLNHQNFGGYLGWRLGLPTFWDGRNEVFGPLMKELVGKSFEDIRRRFDLDLLILMEREYRPLAGQISAEDWALVYWDDLRVVFVRREPMFASVIERNEYRVFTAFGPMRNPRLLGGAGEIRAARAELDRVLRENPETQRALYFRALLSLAGGEVWAAKDDLERANRVRPNPAIAQALLEVLTELGKGTW